MADPSNRFPERSQVLHCTKSAISGTRYLMTGLVLP